MSVRLWLYLGFSRRVGKRVYRSASRSLSDASSLSVRLSLSLLSFFLLMPFLVSPDIAMIQCITRKLNYLCTFIFSHLCLSLSVTLFSYSSSVSCVNELVIFLHEYSIHVSDIRFATVLRLFAT